MYWVNVHEGHFFRAKADHTAVDVVRHYQLDGTVSAVAPLVNRSTMVGLSAISSISRCGLLDESGDVLHELAQLGRRSQNAAQ